MAPNASIILTDALSALNKQANLALATIQNQARADVSQATADAREARRERDEAVKTLHAHKSEERAWKQEAAEWKAAVEQADLTISHHVETINQLRQEASQWKDQCLRLEDTSRQEAISWKEQFLRVEQERCKLSAKINELIAEQLSPSGSKPTSLAPYTPRLRHSTHGEPSISDRPPTYQSDIEAPPKKGAATKSKSKPISETSRKPPAQLPTPTSENTRPKIAPRPSHKPSDGSTSTFIRRVQAVIQIPVKEECVDGEGAELHVSTATSTSTPASTSTSASASASGNAASVKSRRVLANKKRRRPDNDTETEQESEAESIVSSEADEGEMTPEDGSDDEDELMMGVEENRKEVYGIQRVTKPAFLNPTATPLSIAATRVRKRKVSTTAPARKRKTVR